MQRHRANDLMTYVIKIIGFIIRGGSVMGKQLFNLHTHTQRCGHADGTDIQYIHSAIDAGLKILDLVSIFLLKKLGFLEPVCLSNKKMSISPVLKN